PAVTEVSLWSAVAQAHEDGLDPDGFVAWYLPQAEQMLAEHGWAVVELAFEGQEDRAIVARRLPYYQALLAALEERFETARYDHPSWPMLLVVPKGG
ncbi:MAG: hypothetical protein O7B99_10130, partial [Planctomycetota bacterium]|nr:hypothetical protein [Planctomycetota bacterium]